MSTVYTLPYRLDFAFPRKPGSFVPGPGAAGWTVANFDTPAGRIAFMREHANARMPCWSRIEADPEIGRKEIRLIPLAPA